MYSHVISSKTGAGGADTAVPVHWWCSKRVAAVKCSAGDCSQGSTNKPHFQHSRLFYNSITINKQVNQKLTMSKELQLKTTSFQLILKGSLMPT